MTNLVSRLFALFLAFLLCVLAPYSLTVMTDNMMARFEVLSDVESFMDAVADSGYVTDEELSDFYLAVSSHGVLIDTEISRYQKVVNPKPGTTAGIVTSYIYTENYTQLLSGDKFVVRVKPIGYSGPQRIIMGTLGVLMPEFDYTFCKRVR